MSAPPIILYIDSTNKRLVSSFLSTVPPFGNGGISLEAGDLVPMQLHFLTANPTSGVSGQLPYSYVDPATVTPVSVGIGVIGAAPTGGTFTVSWNAATSAALAYNISAAALQTAINALSGIPAGGVTVVGNAGGPWTVTFTTAGAQSFELVINAGELVPVSQGLTAVAIAGASGVQEQEVLTLLQSPAALQTTWAATYGTGSVSRLQAGGAGVNEIQRISVPQGTYGGTLAISFGGVSSASIPFNATAAQVQTALQAMSSIGANNCSVVLSSAVTWDVTFTGSLAGAGQTLMTITSTGLQMPMYLAGSINLNVQGIFNLLIGQASATPTLQIQQGNSGSINTVLLTAITLNATLIQGTPSVPNPANPWQTLTQVEALIATTVATTTTAGTVIVPAAGRLAVDGSGNISIPIAGATTYGASQNLNTRVATAFAVTSNVTLANVTGLTATLAAGAAYSFEAMLYTTANVASGVQAAIAGTATSTSIEYEGLLTSAGAIVNQTRASALAAAVCASTTAVAGTIFISGTIVVNAGGTLTVQFAQNVSGGSASTVLAGSWFKVWPTNN